MKKDLQELRNALVYTKESIARVLGVTVKAIGRMMVWAIGFWVWIRGRRPRLYKKSLFEMDFLTFRRNSSKAYSVKPIPKIYDHNLQEYYVTHDGNPKKVYKITDSYVKLATRTSRLFLCQCEDFKKMLEAYKAPVCKHGYALLSYLGYQTLGEANVAMMKHDARKYTPAEQDARAALGM
jgi:hypothetical protein